MNIADLFSAPMTAQSRPPSGRQMPAQAGPEISRQQMGLGELLAALQVAQMPYISSSWARPYTFDQNPPPGMNYEMLMRAMEPVGSMPINGMPVRMIDQGTIPAPVNRNRMGIVR